MTAPTKIQVDPQTLAVDAKSLGKMIGVSLRKVRQLDASGKLPKPVRIGASVRWSVDELRSWVAEGCPDRDTWNTLRDNGRARR